MADKPRNDLVPPSISETEAKVREELAAERAARIQTERMLTARPPAPAAPRTPEPDFFKKFKDDAAIPDGQAESLERGINQRATKVVADMVGPELGKIRQEFEQERNAVRYEAGLEAMRTRNPDLDDEKIAAAIGATNRELSIKKQTLPPADHIRAVEAKARQLFPKAEKKETAETPPFVEGKSNVDRADIPGGAGKMSETEGEGPQAHPLAEFYFGEGSDVPVVNHDKDLPTHLKAMVEDHTTKKNDYLMNRGVKSFMPKVAGPASRRFKERQKAAQAAAK